MVLPEWFRTIFTASGIWQTCGWTSIIYLSALTSVDQEILEAAMIDGANRFQRIKSVTLLHRTDHLHYADHADWTADVPGI